MRALALLLLACSDPAPPIADAGSDAPRDAGVDAPMRPRPDPCVYVPLPPTANAGGAVEEGAIEAGTAERVLRMPVGGALAAYTARSFFLPGNPPADDRRNAISGSFYPSVGIETAPRLQALVLRAGGETIAIVKMDLAVSDSDVLHDVEAMLGPEWAGKVLLATSHTHSGVGHFTSNWVLQLGLGKTHGEVVSPLVADVVGVIRDALAARQPARLGFAYDGAFDPENLVSHDRREENDDLPNGDQRKDHDFHLIRVDATDGSPIAIVPIFGLHGTMLDSDNFFASTDAPGAIERAIEEAFDERVMVMHLQGAAGDVSPGGTSGLTCSEGPCFAQFARVESLGHLARELILPIWERAEMVDRTEIEMVSRSIELGPNAETFALRGGALTYAPWDPMRTADGLVYDGDTLRSPIDEFNAPFGAGLCGEPEPQVLATAAMPGTSGLTSYGSCLRSEFALSFFRSVTGFSDTPLPICGSTRTTVSALRVGDRVFATIPGEPITLLADYVRSRSPAPADRTIVVGYAQGHMGYVMTPEDWLRGGYEPSINLWGPLEGEYVADRAAELMTLVMTSERENAATLDRHDAPDLERTLTIDPSPMAGTVPMEVPAAIYVRSPMRPSSTEPRATMRRLETTHFVWIGEDPLAGTPRVVLERESAGSFEPVLRRSGRPVVDRDLLLSHTPDPLEGDSPRTHYWAIEWQAVATADDLRERSNLPLGRYRFRVEGTGYELASVPFEVVAGAIALDATVTGARAEIRATYHAPDGFRLLDLAVNANDPAPLRDEIVRVEVIGATTRELDATLDGDGRATIDVGGAATRIRVTDRFGNSGERAL
jgi:neutral ceramidase